MRVCLMMVVVPLTGCGSWQTPATPKPAHIEQVSGGNETTVAVVPMAGNRQNYVIGYNGGRPVSMDSGAVAWFYTWFLKDEVLPNWNFVTSRHPPPPIAGRAAMSIPLKNPRDGLRLLEDLGATPWLVRHHQLVVEAASVVCERFTRDIGVAFDAEAVLLGASLHDAGKVVHPEEMTNAGHEHEAAGQTLLLERGVPATIARFCVTHASWLDPRCTLEDLLVALADKLWKGKRDEDLERLLVDRLVALTGLEPWELFDRVDAICEAIAADGPERLSRSRI